jgi:hypothetical protein
MPLTIIPANDAPVAAATTLTSISEDVADTSNVGTSVFDMVAAITDVDSGANKGIAITAINTTDGRWQYTLNGGTTWVTMLNVSTTNAIPLAANLNHKVRFIPNPTFSGTTTFQFRAWDQTNGTAGQGINVSVNGGTTAFSANTATATLTVDNIVAGIYTSMSSNTKSLQFNGSSAYLSSSTSTLSALTNFTLSFWVNPDTLSGRQDLVGQRGALVTYLDTTTGTNLCVAASGTGRSTECISVTSYLLPNDWTHIAITGEAGRGSLKLFVDGTQRGVFSGSAHSSFGSSVNPMRVAGYVSDASNGNFFAGQIDEISLWNGVFNADTISALQWFHPTGNEPYLLGYWSLDEGSGSTATNALTGASSATHLTTSGSPLWQTSTLDAPASSYREQDPAIAINPIIGLFDIDRTVLTATVRIRSGFVTGDTLSSDLSLANTGNITSTYNASLGVLTLSTSTVATQKQWTNALRGITFANLTSNSPGTSRTFGFTISNAVTSTVEVNTTRVVIPVNDAPTASNSTLTTINEDVSDASNVGTSVANMVGGFSDVDSGALRGIVITSMDIADGRWQFSTNSGSTWSTITSASNSAGLALSASTANKLRFVPNPMFAGSAIPQQQHQWRQ